MSFILWLQSFSSPWLDRFFIGVTMLGLEEFYLLAIPLIYWCFNKREGLRLATVFIISVYLNAFLKDWLQTPRPTFTQGVRILFPESGGGYSFPSGHAQGTVTFWGFIAASGKRCWLWLLAALITIMVALSRPYLGLHFPIDVIGGILIGIAVLVVYFQLGPRIPVKLSGLKRALLLMLLSLATVPLYHNETAGKMLGFFAGFITGAALEMEYVRFTEQASPLNQLVKMAFGLALVASMRGGLKLLLPATFWASWLHYAVVGACGTLLVPLLFVRLGLAGNEYHTS